jgi:hypothetical protein
LQLQFDSDEQLLELGLLVEGSLTMEVAYRRLLQLLLVLTTPRRYLNRSVLSNPNKNYPNQERDTLLQSTAIVTKMRLQTKMREILKKMQIWRESFCEYHAVARNESSSHT